MKRTFSLDAQTDSLLLRLANQNGWSLVETIRRAIAALARQAGLLEPVGWAPWGFIPLDREGAACDRCGRPAYAIAIFGPAYGGEPEIYPDEPDSSLILCHRCLRGLFRVPPEGDEE